MICSGWLLGESRCRVSGMWLLVMCGVLVRLNSFCSFIVSIGGSGLLVLLFSV